MVLISFVGDVGSGKTLGATICACGDDRDIYSNYEIRLPNWHNLQPETLFKLGDKPSLVIIDEVYIWLESRQSGTPLSKYLSYILFQSRKRYIDFIITAQLEHSYDRRFREMTTYTVLSQAIPEFGFQYLIFHRLLGEYQEPTPMFLPFEIAELFYPLYDTLQLVSPIDEKLIYQVSTDKADTVELVDTIANEIMDKAGKRKITKGAVSDYCLRNGHPKYVVNLVYDAISARNILG
jgi:hypothetical protein